MTTMHVPPSRRVTPRALIAACAMCVLAPRALQADQPPPPEPPSRSADGAEHRDGTTLRANDPVTADAFRVRIDAAIQQTSKARAELDRALERLNAGEDPQAIRRDIRMPILRMLLQARQDPWGEGGVLRGGPGARDEMPGDRGPRGARMRPPPREGDRESDHDGPRHDDPHKGEHREDRMDGPGPDREMDHPMHGQHHGGPGSGPGGVPGGEPSGAPMGRSTEGPHGMGDRDAMPPGAALELLRAEMPEFMGKVDELRKTDAAMAERLVARVLPRIRGISAMRESDPEMYRVRMDEFKGGMRVLELMREYRTAKKQAGGGAAPDAGAVERARTMLREGLAAQFDARLKVQELEAARLEARLKEVRDQVQKRRAEREDIVTDLLEAVDRGEGPAEMLDRVPR